MFARMRRRAAELRGVEFCESCGQVCAPGCRAHARLDRTRTEVWLQAGFLR
jgi:hypothetical protein